MVAPPTPRTIPNAGAQASQFAAASQAIGRLEQALKTIPNSDLVTRTLARREAVHSSQIEGTRADLPQLLAYEATHGLDGLPPDVKVTARYVQALETGLETVRIGGRAALTLDLINRLHQILLVDDPRDFPRGAYRNTQVWIGTSRIEDATFIPAPPDALAGLMQEMEDSIFQYKPREDEQGALSIPAQLAIAHAQFETIHPFADGNGRVGRLLMPLLLAADGYPPLYLSGMLLRHRRAYYDALADVQLRGDWTPWVTLLCHAVVSASDDAIAIAKDLDAIRLRWLSQLDTLRSDATSRKLPHFLLGHPVISVNQVADAFGIPFVTANKAIEQLVARGILTEPKQRRNRVFHAREILARLEHE